MFHLAISNIAQHHVALHERHVALHERHVALHERHVALHESHVALHVRHVALLLYLDGDLRSASLNYCYVISNPTRPL